MWQSPMLEAYLATIIPINLSVNIYVAGDVAFGKGCIIVVCIKKTSGILIKKPKSTNKN